MASKTRRQLIQIVPLAGLGLLAACGDKKPAAVTAAPPVAPPAPAPAPVETAAAAPAAPAAPAPAAAPATAGAAPANLPMVAPDDATAVSLGYQSDATKVDKAKYPQQVAGSRCGNCSLFQGAAGAASGPCPLFPGKQVNAGGWCSAYVKKAA